MWRVGPAALRGLGERQAGVPLRPTPKAGESSDFPTGSIGWRAGAVELWMGRGGHTTAWTGLKATRRRWTMCSLPLRFWVVAVVCLGLAGPVRAEKAVLVAGGGDGP